MSAVVFLAFGLILGYMLAAWRYRVRPSQPILWSTERRQMFIADETRSLR